jgi:hypothetical protein
LAIHARIVVYGLDLFRIGNLIDIENARDVRSLQRIISSVGLAGRPGLEPG